MSFPSFAIVKYPAHVARELPHFWGNAAYPFGFDDSDGEAAKSGHVFRTRTCPYATAIFIIVPINDVMAAIFDGPVLPVYFERMLWVGLFGSSTGYAIGDIQRGFATLLLHAVPLDDERLSDVRKIEG